MNSTQSLRPRSEIALGVAGKLAGALSTAFILLLPAGAYADANTVKLRVAARVASFFRVQMAHQADSLTITESDIRRGYIDFYAATQFSVATNVATGFAVDFQPTSDIFVSVKVTGLQTPTEFGASGGSALQNGQRASVSSHRLDYRFYVRQDASPGAYPWPMTISVHAVS
jgi:hypothetical protein